ncbi:hypothetical protein BCR34DRAFT_602335 [Clohesyomyces aquaticus]|uniref:Gfd2/YDR514C-like C-terminal domain-containing protein n=1 Tax=Clohesyomyces aquaticus TaxID=1231657 RepID=A0A1Y1ZIS0_9PLEO|nr:hypothetical protein BCR34DRAFT_602335 [Clohesyomyces aquaticus]
MSCEMNLAYFIVDNGLFGSWNTKPYLDNNAKLLLILQAYLAQFSQQEIMRSFFPGEHLMCAPENMNDVVLVGVDIEWFERGNNDITEIGLAILDTARLPATDHVFKILECMEFSHFRLKKTAHMVNTHLCKSRPDKFQYGTTKFVSQLDATHLLFDAFTHRRPDGTNRPVVFVGHAVENDLKVLKQHFSLDLEQLDVVVATLDTQVLAREAGIPSSGPVIGLMQLLAHFQIHEMYLHTAGNDIASTMIAAFLTATLKSKELARHQMSMYKGKETWKHVNGLKHQAQDKPVSGLGDLLFCTKCNSLFHLVEQCGVAVWCEKCAASREHVGKAKTHMTEKCGVGEWLKMSHEELVEPCQPCLASSQQKRKDKANTHTREKCGFKILDQMEAAGGSVEEELDLDIDVGPWENE